MLGRAESYTGNRSSARIFVYIFAAAMVVRVILSLELSSSPFAGIPVIDEYTYIGHARALIEEGQIREGFFWQGPFYPFFLAAVFRIIGYSVSGVILIQHILGALTAGLVFLLAERIFDRKTGIVASCIFIISGPSLFFETRLLATTCASLFSVILLLLFIEAGRKPGWRECAILGFTCGLSIITRANFLLFAAAGITWLFLYMMRSGIRPPEAAARAGLAAGAVLLVLLPVSYLSLKTNGNFSPLPQAGSLNLYLGNNPEREKTLLIRPGIEWKELIREPLVNGARNNRESREYFYRRFRDYLATGPLDFIEGLSEKTVQFFSSREMPRNVDPYVAGKHSSLLSFLLWKKGGFGFPFGVIIILAAAGLFRYRSRFCAPVWLFLVLYPVSVIAVFTASRYRVPFIPVLAVPASAGALYLMRVAGERRFRELAIYGIAAAVIAAAVSVPGPYAVEKRDYEPEMYCSAGYELYRSGKPEEALPYLEKAIELSPGYARAYRIAGLACSMMNRPDRSIGYFRFALTREPDSRFSNYYLGAELLDSGRTGEALPYLRKAYREAVYRRDNVMAGRIRKLLKRFEAASRSSG